VCHSAHCIQHNINVTNDRSEVLVFIVNNFVRPEFVDHLSIGLRSSRDHAGANVFCELHGEAAHSTGATVDEHGLTALEMSGFKKRLPRSACSSGQARSLVERKIGRGRCQMLCGN